MTGAFAQAPTSAFEVASVRPNHLDDHIVRINVGPGDRFTARGYTLVLLIQRAYDVMGWNVSGGPDWIRADRFDVSAKAGIAGDLTEQQLRPMLQRLLEVRFKLKVHMTTKELPGYALVAAKSGPKLRPVADGVEHPDEFRMTGTGIVAQAISTKHFARYVAGKLGVLAEDETGLQGVYDVNVTWDSQNVQAAAALPGADPRDDQRFAVFAAIETQLGLKFVRKQVAAPVIVVDYAERATDSDN